MSAGKQSTMSGPSWLLGCTRTERTPRCRHLVGVGWIRLWQEAPPCCDSPSEKIYKINLHILKPCVQVPAFSYLMRHRYLPFSYYNRYLCNAISNTNADIVMIKQQTWAEFGLKYSIFIQENIRICDQVPLSLAPTVKRNSFWINFHY